MISIKDKNGIEKMIEAGSLLAKMFQGMQKIIVANATTSDIDAYVESYLKQHDLLSCSKGYFGYKHASCISVNDEVVHGVPCKQNKLVSGDLVKVDVCASFKGYCADMARCFFVDEVVSDSAKRLVEVACSALDRGIDQVKPGNRIGDISFAVQQEVEKFGYGVVRDFAGHGIGKKMHEDPEILNYGKPGTGPLIKVGMAFAIEPMITLGDYRVDVMQDGWTVKTVDRSLAAHVEDTVIVMEDGPKIITRL